MGIDSPAAGALLCIAALAAVAFTSACEDSAVEWGDVKLKKLAKEDKRAARLDKLLQSPNRFMAVNLTARFVMTMVLAVLSLCYFYKPLRDAASGLFGLTQGGGYTAAKALSALVIMTVSTVLAAAFGVMIPKRLCAAGKLGEGFSLSTSWLYRLWLWIFTPVELAAELTARPILWLFGVKNVREYESVTEEEILMMVDAVNETGALEESQAEMISNIFEFDDTEIREVMTHRTEVAAIEGDAPIRKAVELAIETGFSRIPVYKETIDDIEGVILAKDMLTLVFHESSSGRLVRDFMRDVIFAPENQKCGELFKEMTEGKAQMAVAVDEYGGTAGVVTLEDLIETIVGNIQDEYDDETEEMTQVTENVFDMEGTAGYQRVLEAMGLEPEDDSPYETIGALVIDLLGRLPEDGETPSVTWRREDKTVRFTVIKALDRRIEKLRAVLEQEREAPEGPDPKEHKKEK